jgi:uncharacterized protein (TIGR03083 family)
MSSLTIRQNAAIRDLDAFIARLHGLTASQWHLPTPDKGWEVRHLASHLVGTASYMTSMLRKIVTVPNDPTGPQPANVTPDSPGEDIITSLTHARNMLSTTLAEMTDDDLERVADTPTRMFSPTGELYLNMVVFETGIHRYDLDASVDRGSAGLDETTVRAIDAMFGANMPVIAATSASKPDEPVAYHFNGSLIQRYLTWDGQEWRDRQVEAVPLTTIQASDTVLALFICGRIPADDRRLGIRGDKSAAEMFKTYVPGP